MIPTRLELKNIGAIPAADIDLRSVDLAAVVGPNGVGKSTTFTFAPLWALFGSTKNGCSPDDMVRLGQNDAAVSIEFEHAGQNYRVTRTRSTNGRGKSSLELQKLNGTGWEPLSGATIRETEEKIRTLLGLDEETFTSSSMILQGRSNEFTAKAPGQRKAILAEILGLSVYEDLQAAAKVKANALQNEIERIEDQIRVIDEALQEKAGAEADLESAKGTIEVLSKAVAGHEAELKAVQAELAEAKARLDRKREYIGQLAGLNGKIHGLEDQIADINVKLAADRPVLEKKTDILAEAERYDQTRDQVMTLEAKLPRLDSLRKAYARFDAEAKRLEAESAKVVTQKAELEAFLQARPKIEAAVKDLAEAKANVEGLLRHKEELANLEKAKNEAQTKLHGLQFEQTSQRDRWTLELQAAEKKAAILANSKCVDPAKAEVAPCLFLQDAVAAAKQLPELRERLGSYPHAAEIQQVEANIERLDGLIYNNSYCPYRHQELKEQIEVLEPLAAKAPMLEAKADMLKAAKENELGFTQSIAHAKGQLEELTAEGKALNEDLAPLARLKADLPTLEKSAEARRNLPAIEERVKANEASLASLSAEVAATMTERGEAEAAMEKIDGVNLRDIEIKEFNIETGLSQQRKALELAHSDRGALEAKLASLRKAEAERSELWGQKAPKASELTRWQTLTRAFGRDGIPALIIENAVPELERISNEILGQMSNGQHSLRFETQRELKSRTGMAETLDIIVSDWMGARPYETFSGGEQLRIDLAIRFALAELLANRAGSKIEAVVIDEGLSSQDSEHRELVLEAIRSIKGRFRQILIITHLEEVKDAFGQQIRFERKGEEVEVTVS